MASLQRYVNRASSAGGDGTTNATSGANRAYVSIVDWEAAEQQDLTDGGGDTMTVDCEGTSADAPVGIAGWTTGLTTYILIRGNNTAAGRHAGIFSTSKYRIADTGSTGYCIDVQEDYVRFENFQLSTTGSVGVTFVGIQWRSIGAVGANQYLLDRIISKAILSGTADGEATYASGTDANINIKSCLFMDWIRGSATCYGGHLNRSAGGGVVRFHNCSIVNCWRAIRNCLGKNVLAQGSDTGSVYIGNTLVNCSSNDASTDGTNPVDNATYTFVNEAGDDYHLTSGDAYAYHAGADLTADANLAVTLDIDGETIATTFDIGADWVPAAGGGTNLLPKLQLHGAYL
jgi:hypothetical protein